MPMRLNQAKDMSINVAIDCLYSSMTFTATNEQEQRRPERTVSSLILIHTYTCVHMSIQIFWVFLPLLLLSCCSFVSIFVRFHMDLVDDFMENLFFVMLILSFIGISKLHFFIHSPYLSLSLSFILFFFVSLSSEFDAVFKFFRFRIILCASYLPVAWRNFYFPIKIHMTWKCSSN